MSKTILLHDGQNNVIKGMNKYLIKILSDNQNNKIIFNRTHGSLFSIYQQHKPDVVFLQSSEYSQETQDFIADHHKNTDINLLIDVQIANENLNKFLNNAKVKIIKHKLNQTNYVNTISVYDNLYDDEIFFDKKAARNNKILAILSKDNSRNDILNEFLYPNTDHRILVMNNPAFRSPVNVGLFNYLDLGEILNTFDKLIDIDNFFCLEAQACNIDSYEFHDRESLKQALDNKIFRKKQIDISGSTYNSFVTKELISHF